MKALATIGIVLALAIAALLVYAATRPDTFRVERSTTIKAPADKIFPLINDFRRWQAWSPWENIDPALKRSYSGPESGKGAAYAWEGNNEVGHGRMEIDEATPPSKIVIRLHFLKPFETRNIAEYTLSPRGDGTQVTWAMHGPSPFVAKVLGIFCSMDAMVGGKFEEGLAKLKAVAEK
jgi:uncharacterized protein YndB with AHSA1/START domain